MHNPLTVQLVAHNLEDKHGGIARYTQELHGRLRHRVAASLTTNTHVRLADRFGILRHFPLGVQNRLPGSIVHFLQLMGCSQMLWHPSRPAVATVHDLGILVCAADEPACNGLDRVIMDVQLAGLKRMDCLIAVSHFTRQGLISRLGVDPAKIFVVHHGIEHALFRPVADARRRLAERYPSVGEVRGDRIELLYVGNELPRKNLAVLLNAVALLKGRGRNVRLLKVGGAGGERWRAQFLREIKSFGVADNVVTVEGVPDADLPLFYSAAQVFVTSTLMEGFGWPVLEAMACGTPVVCSRAASLPEVVGDAALLFDPGLPEELAAQVERLVDDERFADDLRARGRERASLFTWERAVERTIEVYQELAAHGALDTSHAASITRQEVRQ